MIGYSPPSADDVRARLAASLAQQEAAQARAAAIEQAVAELRSRISPEVLHSGRSMEQVAGTYLARNLALSALGFHLVP